MSRSFKIAVDRNRWDAVRTSLDAGGTDWGIAKANKFPRVLLELKDFKERVGTEVEIGDS